MGIVVNLITKSLNLNTFSAMKKSLYFFGMVLFLIFSGCTSDESNPVSIDDNFTGFWFKQNQHHKVIVDVNGYAWGSGLNKTAL